MNEPNEYTLATPRVLADNEVAAISDDLIKSAKRSKTTGHIYLFFTFMIGTSILLLFAYGYESSYYRLSFDRFYFERQQSSIEDMKNVLVQINTTAGNDQDVKKELISVLSKKLDPPIRAASPISEIAPVLSSAVIRIGAVVVGIFLIQIVVGFSRYYYRLAEHLRICAASLRLSRGNIKDLKAIIPLLMPQFEFGKVPNSPIEKISENAMKTISDVTKKIPSR